MTYVDISPDWDAAAPPDIFATVILAAEHAAAHDPATASAVIAASSQPTTLMVCAVRTLAGLLAGPHAADRFNQLRTDSHALAVETGAPDDQLRLTLMAIALAEAYERGAVGRCEQLLQAGEFTALDLAHAAAVLSGFTVATLAGDHAAAVFAELRRRHGVQR